MPKAEGEAQQQFISKSIKDFTSNQRAKSADGLHTGQVCHAFHPRHALPCYQRSAKFSGKYDYSPA